jgi:hypothetical protein
VANESETARQEVDPEDFLRALLKISPEDAESAREQASKAMERSRIEDEHK